MKKDFLAPVLGTILLLGLSLSAGALDRMSVSSPDGRLTVSLTLKTNPQPYLPGERAYYEARYDGTLILTDSPLGLDFLGAAPLDRDLAVVAVGRREERSTWDNPFGALRKVPDRYNEMTVSLRERKAPGRAVELVFRAFDEGLAFRYVLPAQDALKDFVLASENTGFYFARDAAAWILNMGRFNTTNEGPYEPGRLDDIKPAAIINLPLLVAMPGGPWVALLEADLVDYAGLYVSGVPGIPHALVSRLSPSPDRKAEQAVVGRTPARTPWRVLLVNPRPGGLIESNDILPGLCPPCAIPDTSWIKPGKSAWDWWSGSYATGVDFKPGMNTATMEHYIDFAAAHHLEYMLVDAGWAPPVPDSRLENVLSYYPEIDIPAVITYGKAKGVRVLLWVEWRSLDAHLEEAAALYEKWGAAGIKVDYMNRDDQEMVDFYERVVRVAAAHHLVVDFHGSYRGSGRRRTWPNLLTREGVMGLEYSKWSDRVGPVHDVTLPFTRMLAGPMDYTPGAFHNSAKGRFKAQDVAPMSQGTRAHQLAMYVVFESPLVMLSDYPESYENQPGLDFLEKVPTVWDETRVLDGRPGEFIVIARRSGAAWSLGAMTDWSARDLEIPLSFLGPGKFEARIYADGKDADTNATNLEISRKRVGQGDKLRIRLAQGGGLAIILSPAK
jgi:alpha-glucosidase